jgi:hypothetical protein
MPADRHSCQRSEQNSHAALRRCPSPLMKSLSELRTPPATIEPAIAPPQFNAHAGSSRKGVSRRIQALRTLGRWLDRRFRRDVRERACRARRRAGMTGSVGSSCAGGTGRTARRKFSFRLGRDARRLRRRVSLCATSESGAGTATEAASLPAVCIGERDPAWTPSSGAAAGYGLSAG